MQRPTIPDRPAPAIKAAICAVLIAGAVLSVPAWVWDFEGAEATSAAITANDVDMMLIARGLRETPRLVDTTRWWHGTWVGQVPFWRPVTSLFFWTESRLFGLEHYERWMLVSVILQLIVAGLLIVFINSFTGNRWAGWIAALYFLAWRPPLFLVSSPLIATAPAAIASNSPKNQPEMLLSIAILAALICALSRRWAWLLVFAGIAVGVKESGWLTFPLALAVVVARFGWSELKRVPLRYWIALGTLIVALVAARASAGPEVFVGFHLGSNRSWPVRLLRALETFPTNHLTRALNVPAVLLAVAVYFTLALRMRPIVRVGMAIGALAVATGLQALLAKSTADVALALLGLNWHVVVVIVIWLFPAAALVRDRAAWRTAGLLAGMMVLAALPITAAAQILRHALYLMYLFQAGIIALALHALGREWSIALSDLRLPTSRRRCESPP